MSIDFTDALPTGQANITIPVDQIPSIQAAIINTSAEAAVIFFFIGLGLALVFAYLYFRLWKRLDDSNGIRISREDLEELDKITDDLLSVDPDISANACRRFEEWTQR